MKASAHLFAESEVERPVERLAHKADSQRQLSLFLQLFQQRGKAVEVVKAHFLDGGDTAAVEQAHVVAKQRQDPLAVAQHGVLLRAVFGIQTELLRSIAGKKTMHVEKAGTDRAVAAVENAAVVPYQRALRFPVPDGEDMTAAQRNVAGKGRLTGCGKNTG